MEDKFVENYDTSIQTVHMNTALTITDNESTVQCVGSSSTLFSTQSVPKSFSNCFPDLLWQLDGWTIERASLAPQPQFLRGGAA